MRKVTAASTLAVCLAAGFAAADTTPQTLPFAQAWTNTSLITVNDNWSGVAGIQGFRGDNLTAGTGTVYLTRIALNPPLRTDLVVPIDATASNLTVIIPDTVPVEVRADMTMGNINEGSQSHGGIHVWGASELSP